MHRIQDVKPRDLGPFTPGGFSSTNKSVKSHAAGLIGKQHLGFTPRRKAENGGYTGAHKYN
jgi:hypothetical protein